MESIKFATSERQEPVMVLVSVAKRAAEGRRRAASDVGEKDETVRALGKVTSVCVRNALTASFMVECTMSIVVAMSSGGNLTSWN